MDRGAWWATVYGTAKNWTLAEVLTHTHTKLLFSWVGGGSKQTRAHTHTHMNAYTHIHVYTHWHIYMQSGTQRILITGPM